jgi:cathepsin X
MSHSVITMPTGVELVGTQPVPPSFDWRDVNGKSYATANLNQHIPNYCGSCWIHGTVSALNDRIKIMRGAQSPDIMLSRQALINCVENDDGDHPGCGGGQTDWIFKYMREHPVPDETCAPYVAANQACTPENICMNCFPMSGLPSSDDTPGSCFAVQNFVGYSVGDSGFVAGVADMQKEIFARGPITCGMQVPDEMMYNYAEGATANGGVWSSSDATNHSLIDHDISVTGWGETPEGLKYWLVRNSWGTYWGDAGWFKIRRGDDHLSIESNCSWAVPLFDELDLAMHEKLMGDYVLGLVPLATSDALLAAERAANRQQVMIVAIFGASVAAAFALVAGMLAATGRIPIRQPLLLG